MGDNIKIRTELLHSDICNKILAMCSNNLDMIPSYPVLNNIFDVITSYYNENVYDIDKICDHLISVPNSFDMGSYTKDIYGDKKLLKCYAILFSLTKRRDDIKKKLPVCKFITNIIKTEQLTDTLSQYISMDMQTKKQSKGWYYIIGGLLLTVGFFGFTRSTNSK